MRLLRVLSGTLRAVAKFHDPRVAGVLCRAADDLVLRADELGNVACQESPLGRTDPPLP